MVSSYAADGPGSSDATALQGEVGTFGVLTEQLEKKLGFTTSITTDEDVLVDDVRPGTAAGDCLRKGDKVLDAQIQGTALDITIERNKQFYKAHVAAGQKGQLTPMLASIKPKADALPPPKPFTLNAEQFDMRTDQNRLNASADKNGNKPFTLNAQQQGGRLLGETGLKTDRLPRPLSTDANRFNLQANQNSRLLSQYNVELLVDRSMSMHKPDCPGGMSRWGWCGQQAADLARSLDPLVPAGLTIVPFATQYFVFEHASARHISTLFNNVGLQFGTRLYEPLTERLDNYFAHCTPNTKPLLLVVITDGVPVPKFEPGLVKNELIEASRRMNSPTQVTVIFCQIGGDDRFGQRYLTELDQGLVSQGARYHYVHTIQFDDLQAMGLGTALASTIRQYASTDPSKLRAQAF
jgi:hypothetical protein